MKFIITILLIVFTGALGLYDFQTDYLLGFIHSYDVAVIILNIIFIKLFIEKSSFQRLILNSPLKYIFYIYLLIIIVTLSMPFRGSTNLMESFKVGIDLYLLPLVFIITYDLIKSNNFDFYKKLFYFIAIFTSIQIIVNAISPDLISSIFENVRAREKNKFDFQRNDFISKSMLFPHFATLLVFYELNKKLKIKKMDLVLFSLFIGASGLQGFRSYFAILCLIIVIYLVLKIKFKRFRKLTLILISVSSLVIFFDFVILNKQIYNKFISIPLDFQANKSEGSTSKGRIEIDLIYSIPKFLEKPLFGWGFIYYNSEYGKQIGLEDTKIPGRRAFTLYSVDSGYLSVLNSFGIIGTLAILLLYYKFAFAKLFKFNRFIILASLSLITFSLPTHSAFYSDFGLVPFTFLISIGFFFCYRNIIANSAFDRSQINKE